MTIPSSVKTIDVYAFNKCPLKEVKISKDCVLGSQAFGKDVKIKINELKTKNRSPRRDSGFCCIRSF